MPHLNLLEFQFIMYMLCRKTLTFKHSESASRRGAFNISLKVDFKDLRFYPCKFQGFQLPLQF